MDSFKHFQPYSVSWLQRPSVFANLTSNELYTWQVTGDVPILFPGSSLNPVNEVEDIRENLDFVLENESVFDRFGDRAPSSTAQKHFGAYLLFETNFSIQIRKNNTDQRVKGICRKIPKISPTMYKPLQIYPPQTRNAKKTSVTLPVRI